MPADQLLERLDLVRPNGPDRWMARCPAHEDRGPSLSIREVDGKVLLHCFGAGCSALEVVEAWGLTLSDLFDEPPRESRGGRFQHGLRTRDALLLLRREAFVIAIASERIRARQALSDADMGRVTQAATRIAEVCEVVGVRDGR